MAKKATKKTVPKKPAPKPDKRYALPKFKGRMPVYDAIDGLMAYDNGATDSGIKDENLRAQLVAYVDELTDQQHSLLVMGFIHARIHPPYQLEDMLVFLGWCRDNFGTTVDIT